MATQIITAENIDRRLAQYTIFQLRAISALCGNKKPTHMDSAQLVTWLKNYAATGDRALERLDRCAQAILNHSIDIAPPKTGTPDGLQFQDADAIIRFTAEDGARKYLEQVEGSVSKLVDKVRAKSEAEIAKLISNLTKKCLTLAEVARPIEIRINGKGMGRVEGVVPAYFEKLVRLAASRMNILLVGPAGCGKTYIAEQVAKALKLRFASISCSVGMSETQLAGWLLPVGAAGRFEHVMAQFIDLYENGGLFLLDEMDNADSNTLTFLNKALANDHFFVPQRYKKPLVKRHKDFVCMAAANTFGHGGDSMYIREQLDGATLDRFRAGIMHVTYDDKVEEAIVDPEVLRWGRELRTYIARLQMKRVVSTRVMKDFTKLKQEHGFGMDYWNEAYFTDWEDRERHAAIDALKGALS